MRDPPVFWLTIYQWASYCNISQFVPVGCFPSHVWGDDVKRGSSSWCSVFVIKDAVSQNINGEISLHIPRFSSLAYLVYNNGLFIHMIFVYTWIVGPSLLCCSGIRLIEEMITGKHNTEKAIF